MNKQNNLIDQDISIRVGMFNLRDGRNVEQLDADTYPKLRSIVAFVDERENYAFGLCPVKIMLPFSFGCLAVKTDEILRGREATALLLNEAAKQGIELPAAEFCVDFDKFGVNKGEAFLPSRYELDRLSSHGAFWQAWQQLGILSGDLTFLSSSVGMHSNVWMRSFSRAAVTGWQIQYRTFGVMPAVEIPL